MSGDSYQAIYDAVRSRISGVNVGDAIEQAMRGVNLDHHAQQASQAIQVAAAQYERPSAVYRPSLAPDGDQWSALYGENLAVGVSGFGPTPEAAMRDFDEQWFKPRVPASARSWGVWNTTLKSWLLGAAMTEAEAKRAAAEWNARGLEGEILGERWSYFEAKQEACVTPRDQEKR